MTIKRYIRHLHKWAVKMFGEGPRVEPVLKHIESELAEIRGNPTDIMEWVDVIMLAMDGACRAGHSPKEISDALQAKLVLNRIREWDAPREGEPCFHKCKTCRDDNNG